MMRDRVQLHGLIQSGVRRNPSVPDHEVVDLGRFAALTSPFEHSTDMTQMPPDDVADAALNHHHILLGYCADHAVLPLRFGTVFSNNLALRQGIEAKAALYLDALSILKDHKEYSVNLDVCEPPVAPADHPRDGRAFLSKRRDLRDQRTHLADLRLQFARSLRDTLSPLSAQPPTVSRNVPDRLLDLSLLLSSKAVQNLQQHAKLVESESAKLGLSISLKGPWPAYHFDTSLLAQEALAHGA